MERPAIPTLRDAVWRVCLLLSFSAAALVSACADDVTAPDLDLPNSPTVRGIVTNTSTGEPIAGAEVVIDEARTTTGPDGRFQLTNLTAGPAQLRCAAVGFDDFEAEISVSSGIIYRAISLERTALLEFGDFALYVPPSVASVRAILLALGGPDTRAFASGGPFGAPVPELEASLQTLGESFRSLARNHELAILATSLSALANGPESDRLLLDAAQEAAALSGRPELENVPLLLYGISGGAPEAGGFAVRNPWRVAALFLKVPAGVEPLTSSDAMGVPTYMMLAELDAFLDNAALQAAFAANRRTGAPWALALEPGVPHHSLTVAHRRLTTDWMSAILSLRLGAAPTDPLRAIGEYSGWLGDHDTGEVAPLAAYSGTQGLTSWLPSELTAQEWQAFGGAGGLAPFSVHVEPEALTVAVGEAGTLTATVLDPNGSRVGQPIVDFSSNREDVAEVHPGGPCDDWECESRPWLAQVVGIAEGEAQITAVYGNARATVRVTVLP